MAADRTNEIDPTRRRVLRGALAAATVATASPLLPRPLYAAGAQPEVTKAVLGFIALTDASPLIIAKEKGLLRQARHAGCGSHEAGVVGHDARQPGPRLRGQRYRRRAHPDSHAVSHQQRQGDAEQRSDADVHPGAAQSRQSGISVAAEYADLKLGLDAKPFKAALEKKKASGQAVKAAMTFPGGTHDCWIRYWLAAGGIDPDKDIETIVVPPPQMVANMKVGTMDCFCVGEPWNEQLKNQKIGYTAINTAEIWNKHPEKSFAMRAEWVDKHPNATKALLMAVLEAQMWCDEPANRVELANIVSGRQWFNCPVPDILPRLQGRFDYGIPGKVVDNSPHVMKFWKDNASYPYRSHELWFLVEGVRWAQVQRLRGLEGARCEGQSRGLVARRRQGAWSSDGANPRVHITRHRDFLRRQSLRPGESGSLSREPRDQAVELSAWPARLCDAPPITSYL